MKKLFSIIALLTLSVGLWAATQSVSYLYPVYKTDGVATSGIKEWKTGSATATVVENASEQVTWNAGWYVVKDKDVKLAKGAVCSGEVHLILADGAKLTATGIEAHVSEKYIYRAGILVSGEGNSLTIYGQTAQSGQLIATSEHNGAGIGGNYENNNNSDITINGGTITATGGRYSSGIGGTYGTGSNIIINGGSVTANGGDDGAGIGGGFYGSCSNIIINGGQITANGGSCSAGIGGGMYGSGADNIVINDGKINATGGLYAAGIGGGREGTCNNLTIRGGSITATGGSEASGIGSGNNSYAAKNIFVSVRCVVKADNYPPKTVIAKYRTDTTDIASILAGKRYATVEIAKTLTADKIKVSGNFAYDGEVKKPEITINDEGYILPDEDKMTLYYNNDKSLQPVNIGTYQLYIDIQGDFYYEDVIGLTSEDWKFTINKATPTANLFTYTGPSKSKIYYDGNPYAATVVFNDQDGKLTGMGDITVKYNGSAQAPSAADDYIVSIDITEGANYSAIENLTQRPWQFTIIGWTDPQISSPVAVEVTQSGKTVQAVLNPEYVDYYQQADNSQVDITKGGEVVYTAVNPDKVDYIYGNFVDLGLPSGLLWAACNMGATNPEDFGSYYAWGDPTNKTNFTWATYPYGNSVNNCTKYQKDNKWTLEPADDMATVNWGSRWRVPTMADFQELLKQCDTIITTYQGVYGVLFISKVNLNTLFLPAAGHMEGTSLVSGGTGFSYWSSSIVDMAYGNAGWLAISGGGWSGYRQRGFSVRPVMDANNASDHEFVFAKGKPAKTEYKEGETLDFTGLEAYLVPVMNVPVKLTDGVTWSANPATITTGCTSVLVTATYNGMTSEPLTVNVVTHDLIPVFSPASCSFTQQMTISIAGQEPNSTIYYTLDGTDPTTKSTVYKEPFTITNTTIVKAIAVKDGLTSGVATALYTESQPEYIDLGLPSGTLWAAYNVGATNQEEFGNYYAWGETAPKEHYNWDTYKWGKPGAFTKYQNDGKTVLDPEDDAATVNWGPEWRIPTKEEWQELIDNCTKTWIGTGVTGIKFLRNDKEVFIPCAFDAERVGEYGVMYWTSSVDNTADGSVSHYYRDFVNVVGPTTNRMLGLPVRAVYNAPILRIEGEPSKKEYLIGEAFDVTGLDVYLRDRGGETQKVTDKVKWTILPATVTDGCASVTIGATYNDLIASKVVDVDICDIMITAISNGKEGEVIVSLISERKDATVYYTTDGTMPTIKSQKYTEPLIVSNKTVVTAVATKDNLFSHVASATFEDIVVPKYVNLGLPSGTLWATCNLGANKSEDFGYYYAWGEIEPKKQYDWDTYKWGNPENGFSKYQNDGKTVLDPEDDPVTANWGSDWHMPTKEEWQELMNNCEKSSETSGVPGVIYKSKINGNEIFLPCAWDATGTSKYDFEYWTSSVSNSADGSANYLFMSSSYVIIGSTKEREWGLPVRPVYKPKH